MFDHAKVFNQPLNNWKTAKVTNMNFMFTFAKAFNHQDLSAWDVGNVPPKKHRRFVSSSGGGNIEPSWK
jgi:surface protein